MSLFNKPAWAKTQTAKSDADDAPNNIFSHSNRAYREIVAEQERKKRLKNEKKKSKLKAEEERRNSAKREVREENITTGSDWKRRRVLLPDLDDDEVPLHYGQRESEAGVDVDVEHGPTDEDGGQPRGPVRRSPRKNKYGGKEDAPAWNPNITTEIVELGETDSEDNAEPVAAMPAKPVQVEEEEESDDEFAELARRARQQQQNQGFARASQTPDAAANSPSPGVGARHTGHDRIAPTLPDPIIQLFISSQIEGTNPMIVHRKLSQNIAQVRRVWCQRQRFSDRKMQEVYFVHRMRRVYDVTTCRSLGLEVDSLGNVMLKGAEGKENVDKVHLEAVTDEIFRQMKEERAHGAESTNAGLLADSDAEDEESQQARGKDQIIRLILKARDREDFKLKVRPTTLFSKIIAAYTRTHLGDDSNLLVRLEFDGEPLNPDEEVRSTEISDLDCVDVHVSAG